MRPLRLDLAGFAVFREPTTIDFTNIDFFALTGPTGSGKSTVLDAICFALYGTVPRWSDRRGVAGALAPSANEARVRLVFEASGERYVATRVVRRVKGRAETRHAGLEKLPAGVGLEILDTKRAIDQVDQVGEILAGTPSEMDAAVTRVIGLPYEQFTTCVILPQGEFARFLQAKPRDRQDILVNLLGLTVYQRIRERATARASQLQARAEQAQQDLRQLADATDEAVAAARHRCEALTALAKAVDELMPHLIAARERTEQARTEATAAEAELTRLQRIAPPVQVADLAATTQTAREAERAAAEAVAQAEQHEEELRTQLRAIDDPQVPTWLAAYQERDELHAHLDLLRQEVDAAREAVDPARQELARAEEAVAQAQAAYDAARREDLATTLRSHLAEGQPCPVCHQTVTTLPPDTGAGGATRAAQRAVADAQAARDAAARVLRDRERELAVRQDRHDRTAERLARVQHALRDAPTMQELHHRQEQVAKLRQAADQAAQAVREARTEHRRTRADLERADTALRRAWEAFDAARDTVAALGPPPVRREDLVAAWRELTDWAGEQITARRERRDAAHAEMAEAAAAADEVRRRLTGLLGAADVPTPADDDYPRAVDRALVQAEAAVTRAEERRAQADALRAQVGTLTRQAQVARELAGHLRADRFERWLLEEALDLLVAGASTILMELSGGQYELVHDKGEFFVIDHHDAEQRRSVRTLSGGETFQASLALALALSEQLAGMSATSTSLESIILDEGFGTLDAATLDTVAATLENLAARGDRMVGVVTHVPALAERIPVRFEINKDARTATVSKVTV